MKRCEACGRFFDAEECPGDHSHIEGYTPPLPPEPVLRGEWTTYELDGEPCPALRVSNDRVVVFGPGSNGHVGVYDYEENV